MLYQDHVGPTNDRETKAGFDKRPYERARMEKLEREQQEEEKQRLLEVERKSQCDANAGL